MFFYWTYEIWNTFQVDIQYNKILVSLKVTTLLHNSIDLNDCTLQTQ